VRLNDPLSQLKPQLDPIVRLKGQWSRPEVSVALVLRTLFGICATGCIKERGTRSSVVARLYVFFSLTATGGEDIEVSRRGKRWRLEMSSPVCYERQLESSGVTIVDHSDVYRPCQASNNASANFQCCYAGDSCLEGGICNYTHPRSGGTGYYIAGCTDPSFTDPSCPTHCGKAIRSLLHSKTRDSRSI
jgi:hypothetical protein